MIREVAIWLQIEWDHGESSSLSESSHECSCSTIAPISDDSILGIIDSLSSEGNNMVDPIFEYISMFHFSVILRHEGSILRNLDSSFVRMTGTILHIRHDLHHIRTIFLEVIGLSFMIHTFHTIVFPRIMTRSDHHS
jgi:hypothetical protein